MTSRAFLNKPKTRRRLRNNLPMLPSAPEQGEANIQGTDDALSATIVDALRQQAGECWTVPPGAREANITVKVRFYLNPDGTCSACRKC